MKLPDGTQPTERWVVSESKKMWGLQLNRTNIHSHFTRHFRVGNVEGIKEKELELKDRFKEIIEETGFSGVMAETYLEGMVAIGYARMLADPKSVTHDQVLKAISELNKRNHDETTSALMKELASTANAAIRRVPVPDGASAADDVIDAEVVGEPDGSEQSG